MGTGDREQRGNREILSGRRQKDVGGESLFVFELAQLGEGQYLTRGEQD